VGVIVGVFVGVGVGVGVIVGVLVGVRVGVSVGVKVGVGVGVNVGVGGGANIQTVTLFVSSVTAPPRASSLPDTLALVVIVMLVKARRLPINAVAVPIVAELPTCQ
jgi:hypothetical protein